MMMVDKSLPSFKQDLNYNINSYCYYYQLGKSLEEIGKFDRAIDNYKQSIESNESFSFAHAALGRILNINNQFDDAIDKYRKAIEINPSFYGFHHELAKIFINKNDVDRAISELQICIEKNITHYPSYKLLADLFQQKEDHQKLITLYKQVLLASRYSPTFYQNVLQDISNLDIDLELHKDIYFKNLELIREYWLQHEPLQKRNEWIIVDGGSSVFTHSLVVAKFLQKMYGYRIAARTVAGDKWYEGRQFLISFGVEKFILYSKATLKFENLTHNQQFQIEKFVKEANNENFKVLLKNFQCEDLHIGDLRYDNLLRREQRASTPIFNKKIIEGLTEDCKRYNFWNKFFNKCNVKAFIASHGTVYTHGLIARLAATKGITVYNISPQAGCKYNTLNELYDHHTFIPKELFLYFWNNYRQQSISLGKQLLENQMGIANNKEKTKLYTQHAYSKDKEIYTHSEICRQLNINSSFPIVVIASHAFNDVPHGHRHRLFIDYYEWLVETLKICYEIPNINWLVKEHPQVGKRYKVSQTAEKLVNTKYDRCQNIKLAPQDMSNLSLLNFCHAVVTVSGTMAHELACFGIPSILAGSSDYSDCGFTYNPLSINEYKTILNSVHQLPKLSQESINKAYVAYAIRHHYKKTTTISKIPHKNNLYYSRSLAQNWGTRIKENKLEIEKDPLFQNFMTQILLNQKHWLKFDELLP